jgi:hypothetical protein
MQLQILPPEKAKKKAQLRLKQWKRQREIEQKRKALGLDAKPIVDEKARPKKGRIYTKKEEMFIKERREEYMSDGMTDPEIATRIAAEMERSAKGIYRKIRRMVEKGEMEMNPNKLNPNNADFRWGSSSSIDRNPMRG